MKKDCEGATFVLEGDWKRFDSTLYAKVILKAVSILRCFYEIDSPVIDRHFIVIYDSVAIKDYYCPGGNMKRAFHGLPSGVKSTNLLGSIINLLCLNYCTNKGSNKKFNFIVGGDDFLVVCKDESVKVDEFVESFTDRAKDLGMKLKFCKVKDFKNDEIEDKPCFFKYTIDENEPVRQVLGYRGICSRGAFLVSIPLSATEVFSYFET